MPPAPRRAAVAVITACGRPGAQPPATPIGVYEQFVVVTSGPSSLFADGAPALEAYIFRPATATRERNTVNTVYGPFDVVAAATTDRASAPRPNNSQPPALGSNGVA